MVLEESIAGAALPEFAGYARISMEVTFGASRIDMLLSGPQGRCYVEAKSVTLVARGMALFPDAPTIRGRKHLTSLAEAVRKGHRSAVAFVVQRPDARVFSPNDPGDREFGSALRHAVESGVEAYAYRCRVSREEIQITGAVPVRLD